MPDDLKFGSQGHCLILRSKVKEKPFKATEGRGKGKEWSCREVQKLRKLRLGEPKSC